MNNRMFYSPLSLAFIIILTGLLSLIVAFLFFGLVSTAFTRIGFAWSDALLLLLLSLIGSGINIPVATLKSNIPVVRERYVRVFGVTYRIPFRKTIHTSTILAINVGGGVIPSLVSIYLITRFPDAILLCIAAICLVALITRMVAKPVKGVGIVTPAFVPPIAAALSATLFINLFQAPHDLLFATAYIGGTLGTLIGADILNLRKIRDLGAPVASIGGAGTFDGVFLAGIIAVLLV